MKTETSPPFDPKELKVTLGLARQIVPAWTLSHSAKKLLFTRDLRKPILIRKMITGWTNYQP